MISYNSYTIMREYVRCGTYFTSIIYIVVSVEENLRIYVLIYNFNLLQDTIYVHLIKHTYIPSHSLARMCCHRTGKGNPNNQLKSIILYLLYISIIYLAEARKISELYLARYRRSTFL